MAKKSDNADSTQDPALEKQVDDMMKVDRETQKSDVAKLAADVNKKLSGGAQTIEVKTAPALPAKQKAKPEPEPEPEAPAVEKVPDSDPVIDEASTDVETDKAVDEIVSKEGDTLLALEDAKGEVKTKRAASSSSWKDKLRALVKSKKTWLVVGLLLVVIMAVPVTRYKVLGLAIKRPVTITVVDSKTSTPVSNAELSLGGVTVKTDNEGVARLSAPVGSRNLIIKKQYYQDQNTQYFVGFSSSPYRIQLIATGRLVPITIINKVTGKPLSSVNIKILDSASKTNSKGEAVIALPTTATTRKAKLSLDGYNSVEVTIQVTDAKVKENSFGLTPEGKIYFLSNLSGKIDVVKTNLDGSSREVILEGTGNEEKSSTSLLASRDWRYLVLKSRRDTAQASLYLIDTKTDKVTQFDTGNAEFNLIGWHGHNFVYSLSRNGLPYYRPSQAIKSYDAERQQLNQLDQSQSAGDSGQSYVYQSFSGFYIVEDGLVYTNQWYGYAIFCSCDNTEDKTDSIRFIQTNGQGKKDYQTFPSKQINGINARLYAPQEVYFQVYDGNGKTSYYEFEDSKVKAANATNETFNQNYPTFLVSPSGKQTFWTELRDGKNALFNGNSNADDKKQLASLSEFTPYGWYTDSYLLLAKNSSELYIATPVSLKEGTAPVKVTDYYKPDVTYSGYGYGYGGL